MAFFQYPLTSYAAEQPWWVNFYVAEYSLVNYDRTRNGIQNRAFLSIKLPFPRDVGYSATHEFGQGFTPITPTTRFAPNIANNGGRTNLTNIKAREFSSSGFLAEYNYGLMSPIRRFSNVTELTMVSEARKKYVFEYILAPKNKEESVAVEDIVGSFRKTSYPTVANGLPERTYPQNLWRIKVTNNPNLTAASTSPSADWLGDPLPCVLKTVSVKKNDKADPVVRILPNGYSNITLLGLVFEEFETGSYDAVEQDVFSKSEISYNYFGFTPTTP